jgi:hypothetical protein
MSFSNFASRFCNSNLICAISYNGAIHGATWPLIPAKCSFNLQIPPYAFLAIFTIDLLINKISMDPCKVIDSWGHGKNPIYKFKYATLQTLSLILNM